MSTTVGCLCGANQFQLKGSPAAKAYCHCQTCRDMYGGDLLSATAWSSDQLIWVKQASGTFKHPAKSITRHFCTFCGETLFGINRLGMTVIPNTLLVRNGCFPNDYSPAFHLFYEQRVINVEDDLPKYVAGWDGPLHTSSCH